ncbi:MAG: helix-turn-helix domain-containing protein [Pirellulaceae bacterium]|nr:helix-turn-helix domain-containing protein [Pirellulaceae bacterium]
MKTFDTKRPEFSPYGFTCEQWVPHCMPRPDRHNEIELNLLTAGSITYLLGGRRTTIAAGSVGIFWAAVPHQIVEFEGETPYYVATIPLTEFLRSGIDRKIVNRVLTGELLIDIEMDTVDEASFRRWERDLRTSVPILERAAQLELRARLMRLSQRISNDQTTSPQPSLSRADQLACFIAQNYQHPLTSESIAEANDLQPNYAMNLFRTTFGTTMTAFIVQHRITHAQRLLVTTDEAILNIAMESGFQSLSRFNEAFKEACGCSPRDYRKTYKNNR